MTGPFNGERQYGGGGGSGAQSLCGPCAHALASTSTPKGQHGTQTKNMRGRRPPSIAVSEKEIKRYAAIVKEYEDGYRHTAPFGGG
eukprot:479165-Rhodomonas_salina.1